MKKFCFLLILLSFNISFSCEQKEDLDNISKNFLSVSPEDQEINPEKKRLIDVIDSYRAFQKDTLIYYLDLKNKLLNIKEGREEIEKMCPGITKHSEKENIININNFIIEIQKNINSCDNYYKEILKMNFLYYTFLLEELIVTRAQLLNNRYLSFTKEHQTFGNNFERYHYISTLPCHQKNLFYTKRFESKILTDNFLFFNNFIKLLYKIIPDNFRNNLTNFYINISPHLRDHLNSESHLEKKLSPDECILDGLTYASSFDKDQYRYIPEQKGVFYGRNMLELNPKLKVKDLEKKINKDRNLQKSKTMEKNLDHVHQLSVRSKTPKNTIVTPQNKKFRYQEHKPKHSNPSLNVQSQFTEKKEKIENQNLTLSPTVIEFFDSSVSSFINDECYRVPERYKAPVIKEKVKTRPVTTVQAESSNQVEKPSSSEDLSDDTIPQVTHYIGGQLLTLFENFWDLKAGFTYQEFKTLFGKFGGIIEEDNKGSHVTLKYTDTLGTLHTGGTWRPHGKASEYGYESTKYLKEYMTQCGLIPNFVKPKSEQPKPE
ncbi:MAG: hypothetical protein ACRYGR_04185 [Janthinobacterium lividum]